MKQLVILSYEFDVSSMTKQRAQETISEFMNLMEDSFKDDELQENYIIKQLFVPSDRTRIKCIYPNNNEKVVDVDIEGQMKKVETLILKHKNPELWDEWNILMRWAKLKNIKEI